MYHGNDLPACGFSFKEFSQTFVPMNPRFFALLLLLLLSSCRGGNGVINPEASSIMPLATGNTWDYVVVTSSSCQCHKVITLGDTERLNGFRGYMSNDTARVIVVFDTIGQTDSAILLDHYDYAEGIDGIYLLIPGFAPERIVHYPARRGDASLLAAPSLVVRYFASPITSVVITTDTLITVPAGSFTCIGYQYSEHSTGTVLYTDFYAVGTGLIERDDLTKREKWELTRATLR